MKTPKEWLDQIKHASDTEVRHGSSVFLIESDIRNIQRDAWDSAIEEAKKAVRESFQDSNNTFVNPALHEYVAKRLGDSDSKKLTRQSGNLE